MAKLDWFVRARLKFHHLQLLVALDDYRQLGKVAALMNVTQPALSKTLGELQSGLGQKLFERTGRGLRPTDYGSALIRHARLLLMQLAEAGDELHALGTGTARKVRVGTLPASASWLVPRALALLKQRSPLTTVFVREGSMDMMLSELRLGHLDMVVGTLPAREAGTDLGERPLFDDATVLVARRGHPLAARSQLRWAELMQYPWVMPPPESLLRPPLMAAFHAQGVEPPSNYVETLSLNTALPYVQGTDAIASMPATLARMHEARGLLTVLPVRPSRLVRPVGILTLRSHPLATEMGLWGDCLEQAARELVAGPA